MGQISCARAGRAAALCSIFAEEEKLLLQEVPIAVRCRPRMPTDPLIYRFYEWCRSRHDLEG